MSELDFEIAKGDNRSDLEALEGEDRWRGRHHSHERLISRYRVRGAGHRRMGRRSRGVRERGGEK
jgi:hypothetical protein